MNFLRLLPVFISLLLLAAHFYRAGQFVLAVVALVLLILPAIRRPWVPWLMQLALFAGAVEWLLTAHRFVQIRIHYDQPWTRLAIILGAVAALTAISGLVFRNKALKARYSGNDKNRV